MRKKELEKKLNELFDEVESKHLTTEEIIEKLIMKIQVLEGEIKQNKIQS